MFANDGKTAVHKEIQNGKLEIVQILVDNKCNEADWDQSGNMRNWTFRDLSCESVLSYLLGLVFLYVCDSYLGVYLPITKICCVLLKFLLYIVWQMATDVDDNITKEYEEIAGDELTFAFRVFITME